MAKFDERVWGAVSRIPYRRLATYGQIADLIGIYGGARQVGWSLRRLPLSSEVPWHRVVNAQSRISMSLSREGSDWVQRQLLITEGIPVKNDGWVPLQRYLWRPDLRTLSLQVILPPSLP
ncbi:methyltransferase [cyanobiont of Ornithocercus magnificus]|nr:methyltransferase [cyanobiont of Ornithocercus magnificus]